MRFRRVVVLCCLLALVVLGGCVSVAPPGEEAPDDADAPDPEALFESTFVYGDDLEDVSGEKTIEISGGDEEVSETVRVYDRPYVHNYEEVIETTDPEREGYVFASTPSETWWYYPERSLAQRHEPDEPFESEAVRSDRADMADWKLEWYDLEYRGTEEIADRKAHVLEIDLREEAVEEGISVLLGGTEYVYALETVDAPDDIDVVEQTVWIDAEYDYPLQERRVFELGDGERYEMTERFESVSFNEGIDDETFEFEPPENVTVESR